MKFKSQKSQDEWVIKEILPNKRDGFFVDLAAANGYNHSNTYALEEYYGWGGICIEPNPKFYNKLEKRKCIIEKCVVSDTESYVKFRVDNNYCGGIVADDTDNNQNNFRRRAFQRAEIVEMKANTLINILDKNKAPKNINYFSLDVEGAEERILSTFEFDKYTFDCMTVERPTSKCNEILFANDYVFVKNHKFDSFYIHKSIADESRIVCEPFEQVPPKKWKK